MKTSVVPAQVTSIEDTITAKLSLTQIVLLILPVFLAAIIFTGLPPSLHIKLYKLILTVVIAIPITTLALRINGQLLLRWLVMLSTYQVRPRRYIATLSWSCSCNNKELSSVEDNVDESPDAIPVDVSNDLEPAEYLTVNNFLNGKQVIYCSDKKGQLNAVIEAD